MLHQQRAGAFHSVNARSPTIIVEKSVDFTTEDHLEWEKRRYFPRDSAFCSRNISSRAWVLADNA
jgi:hypothetical protein